MEPVVVLEKLPRFQEAAPVLRRKRRRRNRKYLFYRLKKSSKNTSAMFYDTSANISCASLEFKGFRNGEIDQAFARYKRHPCYEETLISSLTYQEQIEVRSPLNFHDPTASNKLTVTLIQRRKVRVLALFDGISTALHILSEVLNLDIDVYFSSEIDEDALAVQRERHFGKIIQLGSVVRLQKDLLNTLGRIDLLLGGSPCNELACVNWRRKEFSDPTSSACLIKEFVRIRDFFLEQNKQAKIPFFYLFENTRNMTLHSREVITSLFGVVPIMSSSIQYLPVERARLFWGNIPNMASASYARENRTEYKLQDMLRPGRLANQDSAKTITTNSGNQASGSGKNLPVSQGGKDTRLTINEEELLMGFPLHYTDAASLSVSRRHRLLGKAWCVPVVANLLSALSELFIKKL